MESHLPSKLNKEPPVAASIPAPSASPIPTIGAPIQMPSISPARFLILSCPGSDVTGNINIFQTIEDFLALQNYAKENKYEIDIQSASDPHLGKNDCIKRIKHFFNIGPFPPFLVLTYSGHGAKDGGLQLYFEKSSQESAKKNARIYFDEVYGLWTESRANHTGTTQLFLMIDACFSGLWVDAAQKQTAANLTVQASVDRSNLARDGLFTPCWINLNKNLAKATDPLEQNGLPSARAYLPANAHRLFATISTEEKDNASVLIPRKSRKSKCERIFGFFSNIKLHENVKLKDWSTPGCIIS